MTNESQLTRRESQNAPRCPWEALRARLPYLGVRKAGLQTRARRIPQPGHAVVFCLGAMSCANLYGEPSAQ